MTGCQTQTEPVTVSVTRVVVESTVRTVDVTVEVAVEVDPEAPEDASAPKELTVCMGQEPISLYPYREATRLAEEAVLHGIFENDFTTLSFDYQPVGLEKIPSPESGDVAIHSVEVQAGDIVLDAQGHIKELREDLPIITADGQETRFDGTPVMMDQLAVDFTMKPRVWSDGTPVTAADSVYSFELNADPNTPSPKEKIIHTASYMATGDLSVRWTGIPGLLHVQYIDNFWRPLPGHLWRNFSASELLQAETSTHLPVGDGPFKIVDWVPGDHIRLERNEHYYRSAEGLPYLDSVTFRFFPDASELTSELLLGRCDIATHESFNLSQAPLLIQAEANGLIVPYFQTGRIYEHIDFGVDSWGSYGDGRNRPDWFEDVRVRQAMVMCTDRARMVDQILFGRSEVMHSFVPSDHPLYPEDITEWPYDVAAAVRLLEEAGYVDSDEDGTREHPVTGEEFRIALITSASNDISLTLAQIFRANMLECGIDVTPNQVPADELFGAGPESPLFGRRFDLGQLAWPADVEPLCYLYASWQITGPVGEVNRKSGQPFGGWGAANATGWWDPEYDKACRAAMNALPGTADYMERHREAQRIFAANVPIIPLFPRLKMAATLPHVRNFRLDPSQRSELWNLFEIDLQR